MKFATTNSKSHAAEGCYKIIKMSASKSIFKYKVINYCIVLAFIGLHFNSEVCVRAEWSSNSNKQGKSPIHYLSFFWSICKHQILVLVFFRKLSAIRYISNDY